MSASSQPGWDVPAQHSQPGSWPRSTLQRGRQPCPARGPTPTCLRVRQPGSPESFYWHLGPTGGRPVWSRQCRDELISRQTGVYLLASPEYQPHTQALHLHPTLLRPGRPCLTLPYTYRKHQASPLHSLLKTPPLACFQTSYHSGHCTLITSFDSANACEICIID